MLYGIQTNCLLVRVSSKNCNAHGWPNVFQPLHIVWNVMCITVFLTRKFNQLSNDPIFEEEMIENALFMT
ncbi:Protein of unknown function [Gryllus bimaculatus]|nr:Protein of unknown function [Gryllus bimaculatus]